MPTTRRSVSETALVVGCTYDVTHNRSEYATVTVVAEPNAVDGLVPVTCGGREMRIDLRRCTVTRRRRGRRERPMKTSTDNLFLYLCSIDRHSNFKVGVTSRPAQRIKEIRTYASNAKMVSVVRIPHSQSKHWRKVEREVIQKFSVVGGGRAASSPWRGTEVLSLSRDGLSACRQYMRSVCAR